MAYILSIETADKGCSVAIHSGGTLVASKEDYEGKSSSGSLTILIESCMQDAGLQLSDLNAIAVSKGPGSYTGLRIGVSTAKGMCYALEIPLLSIDSLDTLAESVKPSDADFICPMLDARRMEVYCKVIDATTAKVISETEALILTEDSFLKELETKRILFCGPGSIKAKALLNSTNCIFLENVAGPNARFMGKRAYKLYEQGGFEDLVEFEPFYLKDFLVKKSKKKMPLDDL